MPLGIDFGKITETIKKIWDGFCNLLAPVFIAAFEICRNMTVQLVIRSSTAGRKQNYLQAI